MAYAAVTVFNSTYETIHNIAHFETGSKYVGMPETVWNDTCELIMGINAAVICDPASSMPYALG